ncbi:MAG: D-2-hydroxyacid dehydrogenase [Alphaproteobacteria bacterium]|nr:D-2-hydroxyacid dehydrogenase [Alphaproteobacteria bacterium]MCY4320751.1 D-2-hydroxyacid dehydrogenase [Alphaproteobacteria bacterium]
MKIAAARDFHGRVQTAAEAICPDIEWALTDKTGVWTRPPAGADAIVYAGTAYTNSFVDDMLSIAPPKWAHTEDAGIDGRFYDGMRAKGVPVTHSPGANAPEVAELAFAGLMWGAKHLGVLRAQQHAHHWEKLMLPGLSATTVLIVGLGAIGGRVAQYAKAFGMTVHGIRRSPRPVPGMDRQGVLADLATFLPDADFVVLALPISDDTTGMIDQTALRRMKKTAVLVNVGRGALVDIDALREALEAGVIASAFLDVLPVEPWPADSDLWDVPNLFITPHNGSLSPLYAERVADIWLENLKRFTAGEPLLHRAF